MAYGRRDGFSYADGVPLKLNDRLQPLPQIVFPTFSIGAPNLLENEYDFSVEQRALQQYQQHKQAKEAQEKAKVDRVAQEIEQFAQIPLDTGQQQHTNLDTGQQPPKADYVIVNGLTPSPKSVTSEPRSERRSTLPAWQNATLLNPQPLVKELSSSASKVPDKQFNLADFESQSFSPFDTIELQTLNDLEELNTVFQGMAGTTQARAEPAKMPYQETNSKTVCQPINGYQVHPDVKNYHRYYSNDKPQSYYNGYQVPPDVKNYHRYYSNDKSQSYYKGYSVYGYPLPSGYFSSTAGKEEDKMFPQLKSSKSTPDIRDEIHQQTNWSRSQTPPPYTQPFVQVPVSREQIPNSPSEHLPSKATRSMSSPAETEVEQPQQEQVKECLPNPYHELEENQQLFSANVAQMGFNLDRVARTVKHLGTDEKKVVDHLCCVQGLEESGYEGDDVETALHLYEYNLQEAKRFLDLLKQFQDLGFKKSAARKALIRHKNDRDRALDSLLS